MKWLLFLALVFPTPVWAIDCHFEKNLDLDIPVWEVIASSILVIPNDSSTMEIIDEYDEKGNPLKVLELNSNVIKDIDNRMGLFKWLFPREMKETRIYKLFLDDSKIREIEKNKTALKMNLVIKDDMGSHTLMIKFLPYLQESCTPYPYAN